MSAREHVQRSCGEWLRQRRRVLDLSQEELASQVGCSTITLRKLEAEERRPSKQIAERLAEVLQVPAHDQPNFLRFARGNPFAEPAAAPTFWDPTQNSVPQHNLPLQLTSFIGREKELVDVSQHLLAKRLLTLTGTGGTGKTRLARQAAAGLLPSFPDGVWWVELAPLADPTLVTQIVGAVLGMREGGGQPIQAVLTDWLRAKRLLLVLDNCEHLVGACAQLAVTLLGSCPQLHILATSREVLGVAGEITYLVPALSLPAVDRLLDPEALVQTEAGQLFVDRARQSLPDFKLTPQDVAAVAQVCRRLDGLPLATSSSSFAELGHERNGIFVNQ